jgi:hypothetical protein
VDALYLVCGARRPQLKRDPLGGTQINTLIASMLPLSLPDSVHFRVVYDARHSFPDTALVAFIPLVFVLFGFLVYRQRGVVSRFGGSSSSVAFFGLFAMVVGGLGVVIIIITVVLPDIGLRIALADGHNRVHEGVVTQFVPGDSGDHQPESWCLRAANDSFVYSYSPSILEPGYNLTAAHGGQIANGLRVRVWDVGGIIARLEVAP